MWDVVESKDHGTLVEAQSFFGFLQTTWTEVGTPSLDKLITSRNTLDSNVRASAIKNERGQWKKYHLAKLEESGNECRHNVKRTNKPD